jgi:predicted GNAT family N-acyltransferase
VTSPADPLSLGLAMGRMMQRNKDALGFIPTGGDKGINRSIAAGQVVVAEVDGQLVGYVQWTDANAEHVRIHQCVVSDVWRGSGIGRQMIEVVRTVRPGRVLTCRVRDDLSANEFWARVGFDRIGQETHETSGAPINLYQCGEVEGG